MMGDATSKFVVRFPEALIACTCWEDADALTSCREFLTDHLGYVPSFEACAQLFPEPLPHRRFELFRKSRLGGQVSMDAPLSLVAG